MYARKWSILTPEIRQLLDMDRKFLVYKFHAPNDFTLRKVEKKTAPSIFVFFGRFNFDLVKDFDSQ